MDNKKLSLHPDVKGIAGSSVWLQAEPFEKDKFAINYTTFEKKKNSIRLCGVCASKNTELVHCEGYGDASGGYEYHDHHCQDCNNYTRYVRDWG